VGKRRAARPGGSAFEAAAVLAGTDADGDRQQRQQSVDHTDHLSDARHPLGMRLYASLLQEWACKLLTSDTTRQPFGGGARQHLNQFLARHRAAHCNSGHLSLLFAENGLSGSSLKEAARIPAAPRAMLSEIAAGSPPTVARGQGGIAGQAVQILPESES